MGQVQVIVSRAVVGCGSAGREQSLPTPEIRGSNPDIGKKCFYQSYNRKDENKEKETGNGPS